jgi:hypothetical protein
LEAIVQAPPPPVIDSAKLLAYAFVDADVEFTARIVLFVGEERLGGCRGWRLPRTTLSQATFSSSFVGVVAAPLSSADRRHMTITGTSALARRALPWLLLLYCGASLLHFAHNAEYVADYPNLPDWISSASIYLAWSVIFMIGLWGYLLFHRNHTVVGLTLLAIYTALGLDGLLHYGRAPISAHTFDMNLTIWTEVVTAAVALGAVLRLAVHRLLTRTDGTSRMRT